MNDFKSQKIRGHYDILILSGYPSPNDDEHDEWQKIRRHFHELATVYPGLIVPDGHLRETKVHYLSTPNNACYFLELHEPITAGLLSNVYDTTMNELVFPLIVTALLPPSFGKLLGSNSPKLSTWPVTIQLHNHATISQQRPEAGTIYIAVPSDVVMFECTYFLLQTMLNKLAPSAKAMVMLRRRKQRRGRQEAVLFSVTVFEITAAHPELLHPILTHFQLPQLYSMQWLFLDGVPGLATRHRETFDRSIRKWGLTLAKMSMKRITTDVSGPFLFSDIRRAIQPSQSRDGLTFGPQSDNQILAITQGFPGLRYNHGKYSFVKSDGIAFTIGDTLMSHQDLISMIFREVQAVTIKASGLARKAIIKLIHDDTPIDLSLEISRRAREQDTGSSAIPKDSISSLSSTESKSSKKSDSSVSVTKASAATVLSKDKATSSPTELMLQKIFEQVNGTRADIVSIREDVTDLRGELTAIKAKMKKDLKKERKQDPKNVR